MKRVSLSILRSVSFDRKARTAVSSQQQRPKAVRRSLSFSSHRYADEKSPHDSAASAALTPVPFAKEIALFNDDQARQALLALGLSGEARRWPAATFLHCTPGLDMAILGELLGHPDHVPLMRAYVQRLDCRGLNLERALRALLSGFRLPGEAQKIDRILEAFAQSWHATASAASDGAAALVTDPAPISSDTAYIVCFALIMLNTDVRDIRPLPTYCIMAALAVKPCHINPLPHATLAHGSFPIRCIYHIETLPHDADPPCARRSSTTQPSRRAAR